MTRCSAMECHSQFARETSNIPTRREEQSSLHDSGHDGDKRNNNTAVAANRTATAASNQDVDPEFKSSAVFGASTSAAGDLIDIVALPQEASSYPTGRESPATDCGSVNADLDRPQCNGRRYADLWARKQRLCLTGDPIGQKTDPFMRSRIRLPQSLAQRRKRPRSIDGSGCRRIDG